MTLQEALKKSTLIKTLRSPAWVKVTPSTKFTKDEVMAEWMIPSPQITIEEDELRARLKQELHWDDKKEDRLDRLMFDIRMLAKKSEVIY